MELALIAAVAEDGYIGLTKDGKVGFPWPRLKGDLPRFKKITTGCPIIMGRKTYESFGGKPLAERLNIVLTSNPDHLEAINVNSRDQVTDLIKFGVSSQFSFSAESLDAAVNLLQSLANDDFGADLYQKAFGLNLNTAFVIGGNQPYQNALASSLLTRMYLTEVHGSFGGDTKFPNYDRSQWQEVNREKHPEGTHSYVDLVKR